MQPKIIKIVYFYTTHDNETLRELEIEFNKRSVGSSKKIFDYLESSTNLLLIETIKTKKEVKKITYTTKDQPNESKKRIFLKEEYPHNIEIIKYLSNNENLEFIDSIETDYIIV